jgi:DivIVA domain-containing protein
MPSVQHAITILEVLGVLGVLFVAGVLATRDGDVLVDVAPDDPDLELPLGPLQPEDIRRVRFGLVVRGYRMREVDQVLERLADEVAARDARLLALEQALVHVVEPHVEEAEGRLSAPAEEQLPRPEPVIDDVRTADVEPAPAPAPVPEELDLPAGMPGLTITSGAVTAVTPPAEVVPSEPVAQEHPPEEPPKPESPQEHPTAEAPITPLDPTALVPRPVQRWPQPELEPEPESLPSPLSSVSKLTSLAELAELAERGAEDDQPADPAGG